MCVSFDYKPAILFAERARQWHEKTLKDLKPLGTGEPPMLVLIYCVMSIESFIYEQLDARLEPGDYAQFTHDKGKDKTLADFWLEAVVKLATDASDAKRALHEIKQSCKDTGQLGLLIRARNKLVHPKRVTEGPNKVDDIKIQSLIDDIKKSTFIPHRSAQFPGMLISRESAQWSMNTLRDMISNFFRAVSEPPPKCLSEKMLNRWSLL